MENPLSNFIINFTSFFMERNFTAKEIKNAAKIFRIHNEKLKDKGEISFSIAAGIWEKYFGQTTINLELCYKLEDAETQRETLQQLLDSASHWMPYPVQELIIAETRCVVFLNRYICIEALIKQVLAADNENGHNPFGVLKKRCDRKIQLNENETRRDGTNLPMYRASLIHSVLRRILFYSEWMEVEDNVTHDDKVLRLRVISVTEDMDKNDKNSVFIKCGSVLDPTTGKLAKLQTQEYLNLRTADMRLMAMHKYGIRTKNDQPFIGLMERLGEAAVTVDLLEVKHSTPVQLIRNGQGSTKGASFILYNSARLETLLRKFENLVANSTYSELPSMDATNFKLLGEEEEWQLCFGYILQFPYLIERCLEQIEKGVCSTHLIVRYLSGFVAVFSIYYRRVRILTQETRAHLMPYVYARIYLIKAVRVVLNKTLALLDIKPMAFM